MNLKIWLTAIVTDGVVVDDHTSSTTAHEVIRFLLIDFAFFPCPCNPIDIANTAIVGKYLHIDESKSWIYDCI